jgi:hypothetical protein
MSADPRIVEGRGGLVPHEQRAGAVTPITSIENLITRAVEAGATLEVVERILDLRQRLADEQAKAAFREALSEFQGECPVIRKRRSAEVKKQDGTRLYTYMYASLDAIVRQVRPLLARHGLSYTFETEYEEGAQPAIVVTCVSSHVAGHSERTSVRSPIPTDARINVTQQSGVAETYGKRRALCNAFGIVTGDEDTDGGAVTIDDRPRTRSGAPAAGGRPAAASASSGDAAPAQPSGADEEARLRALNAGLPERHRWSAAVLRAEMGRGMESAMARQRGLHEQYCEGCTHFDVRDEA